MIYAKTIRQAALASCLSYVFLVIFLVLLLHHPIRQELLALRVIVVVQELAVSR